MEGKPVPSLNPASLCLPAPWWGPGAWWPGPARCPWRRLPRGPRRQPVPSRGPQDRPAAQGSSLRPRGGAALPPAPPQHPPPVGSGVWLHPCGRSIPTWPSSGWTECPSTTGPASTRPLPRSCSGAGAARRSPPGPPRPGRRPPRRQRRQCPGAALGPPRRAHRLRHRHLPGRHHPHAPRLPARHSGLPRPRGRALRVAIPPGPLGPLRRGPPDDLYALGVTACRLVTASTPSSPTHQDAQGSWHLEVVIFLPPRCSSGAPAASLILRMLSVRPEERGTAAQLAEALEQAVGHSRRRAPPPRAEGTPAPRYRPDEAANGAWPLRRGLRAWHLAVGVRRGSFRLASRETSRPGLMGACSGRATRCRANRAG